MSLVVLVAGCGPDDVASTGTTGAASTTQTESGTGTGTGTDTGSTDPVPTTGEAEPCGCVDPQVVDGNLFIEKMPDFAGGCIGEVTGILRINGLTDPAVLQPLVGLRRAYALQIYDNPGLVDLSVMACLEEVTDRLNVQRNPALVDVSALAHVRQVRFIELKDLPITTLPSFAPDFHGFRTLDLSGLPELVDLAPVAGWPGLLEEYGAVGVTIVDVPKLKSIAELAGPIGAPMVDVKVVLELADLPSLTDLTGLEAVRDGYVRLASLPQVTSLAPLAGLEQADELYLDGLTGLTSLEGLHNLRTAIDVRVTAMPGLGTLDGLRALERAAYLQIGGCGEGEGLVSLSGAPQLGEVGWLDLIDNPKLTAEAVAAFDATIKASQLCFGGEIECGCLGALPEALDGCPAQWSGGSAVTVTGEGGPLDGTTAFFGWTHMSGNYNDLNLVIADASADLEAVKDDGLWQTSDGSIPKLVMESAGNYQQVLGTHESFARIVQSGAETEVPVKITLTERLGDWTMINPADPPRLAGEFTFLDPNAATIVTGPFDAVFCDAFELVTSD